MSANHFAQHIPTNATPEQLTFNKESSFIFNLYDSAAIHCGNLAFSDFSTSTINAEEQVKYTNCMNNLQGLARVLPRIFN